MSISDQTKITKLYQGAANAVACDIIDMSDFVEGALVVIHTGANDTDLVLSLYEATTVGGSTNQAITTAVPIWIDIDMGTTSDTLTRTTDAYAYTIDPATMNGAMVVFEIDPAILSDGYPCVYLADSGGHASNTCTILFVGKPRHASASLPSAIA